MEPVLTPTSRLAITLALLMALGLGWEAHEVFLAPPVVVDWLLCSLLLAGLAALLFQHRHARLREFSQRQAAAHALAASEERYHLMFDRNPLPTWIWNQESLGILDVNQAAVDAYGYSREEFLAMNLRDIRPPEDVAKFEARARSELPRFTQETWRHRRRDGRIIDVLIHSSAFQIDHTPARMAVAMDITEQLRAEREKTQAWSTLDALYATAPVGLGLVDRELRYLRINDHLAKTNGLAAQRHLGQRPGDVLPLIGKEVEEHFRQVIDSGKPRLNVETRGETPAQPGVIRHWLTGYYPIFHGNGTMGAGVVVQEITARKAAEQALLDSQERLQTLSRQTLRLQEDERRALARELHDEAGQQLAALKFNLAALRRPLEGTPHIAKLEDSLDIVNTTLALIRDTALNLRPSVLDDLGLAEALDWYCRRQAERSGCAIKLRAPVAYARMSAELETACFRIAQEAVNNALRHGRPSHILVQLEQDHEQLQIKVSDDGCGFDVPSLLQHSQGAFGLGLLGMRERAELLGGNLSVSSTEGKGAEICATLPLPSLPENPHHEHPHPSR